MRMLATEVGLKCSDEFSSHHAHMDYSDRSALYHRFSNYVIEKIDLELSKFLVDGTFFYQFNNT